MVIKHLKLAVILTLLVGLTAGQAMAAKNPPPPPKQKAPPPPKQATPPPKKATPPPKQATPPPKQKAPPPKQEPPPKSKTPAPTQKGGLADFLAQEKPITWLATSLADGMSIARSQKKVLYAYFYFEDKDDFPKNYDDTLMSYSEDRAVFAKVFVKTDSRGKIVEEELNEFFARHRLSKGPNAVLLDYYGNFLDTVSSTASNKITPAIDDADKKIADIEGGLNHRYEKAIKLEKELEKNRDRKMPEYIKALNQVAEDKFQGYPSVEEAQDKLKELDKTVVDEHNSIIKAYHETEEEDRDPDEAVNKLEPLAKTYKGLPAEKLVQESIGLLKKGQLPPLPKEPEQATDDEEAKKDAPAADDKSASNPSGDEKEPEEDK